MRRMPISQYWRVSRRSGVMDSVARIKIRVQSPVEWVMTSMGFAPRPSWKPFHARRPSGISAAGKTTNFRMRRRDIGKSEVRSQIEEVNPFLDASSKMLAKSLNHRYTEFYEKPHLR